MNYFVTGTDTGAGKTFVTALLTRSLRAAGLDTVALKPICCGPRDDAETLRRASDDELSLDETNPVWLSEPTAPLVAAEAEGRTVDLDALAAWFQRHRARRRSLLVEGVGGWLVPVADGKSVADLARIFALPVLVVVANRLGCLNHTLLTIESIRAHGLPCAGIILNTLSPDHSPATRTNRSTLERLTHTPILFEITPNQNTLPLAIA